MTFPLLAAADTSGAWQLFGQYCLDGLTNGSLIALIALRSNPAIVQTRLRRN